MTKRVGLYSRVSTKDQTCIQQLEVLREYCKNAGHQIVDEYVDHGLSAMKSTRPEYKRILEDARKRRINLILVYKIDRFSRSVKELLNTMDLLYEYGCDFTSYSDKSLDTSTSSGRLCFQVIASVCEFERSIISERTRLKLNYLKSKGIKLGRKVKVNPEAVLELRAKGLSLSKIGKELSLDKSTVCRSLQKSRIGDRLDLCIANPSLQVVPVV